MHSYEEDLPSHAQEAMIKDRDEIKRLKQAIVQAKHELNSVKMDGSHIGKAYRVLHEATR